MSLSDATSPALAGVLSVLCTPFTEDASVDEESLRRLIEHNLAAGVHGIVCFGLAGEAYKLTDEERRRVLRIAIDTVDGAVPVVAGTEHSGLEAAAQRSVEAQDAGADAVMMYPPTFVKPGPAEVADYYRAAAEAVEVPVIVQDAPAWTGVPLPVDLLASIRREAPGVRYVKVEAPPTAVKVDSLRSHGFDAIGGYGALHLAEELASGIVAFMPGCALPALYVRLWELHQHHDAEKVWSLFAAVLPLLTFQLSSLDTFVSVQKLLLHRLGVQTSTRMRGPGASLRAGQVRWLDEVLSRIPVEPDLLPPSVKSPSS